MNSPKYFTLILSISLLFLSCSNNAPEKSIYQMMPANTVAHFSLDLNALAEKGDFEKVISEFLDLANKTPEESSENYQFRKLLVFPSEEEIGFSKGIDLFVVKDNTDQMFPLCIFHLHENSFLENFQDNNITKHANYSLKKNKDNLIAWNKNIMIVSVDPNNMGLEYEFKDDAPREQLINRIFSEDMPSTLYDNENFKEYLKTKDEIKGWLSVQALPEQYKAEFLNEFGLSLDSVYLNASISLREKDILANIKIYPPEIIHNSFFTTLCRPDTESDIIKYVSIDSTSVILAAHVDINRLNEMFEAENLQSTQLFGIPDISLADITKLIKGNIVIGISNFYPPTDNKYSTPDDEFMENPDIVVMIDVKNPDFFINLAKDIPFIHYTKDKNLFRIIIDSDTIYYKIINNVVIFSNKMSLINYANNANTNKSVLFDNFNQYKCFLEVNLKKDESFQLFFADDNIAENELAYTESEKHLYSSFENIILGYKEDLTFEFKINIHPKYNHSFELIAEVFLMDVLKNMENYN